MRRAAILYAGILLSSACGNSVTSDPGFEGGPPDGLVPTDIPHVSWAELDGIILSGKVVMVAETHSNWAIVTLRDGRSIASREPEPGAVFRVVNRCGVPCRAMGIAIE